MILSFKLPGWRILYKKVIDFKVSMLKFTSQFTLVGWTWLNMTTFNFFFIFSWLSIMLHKYKFISLFTLFFRFFILKLNNLFIYFYISSIGKLLLFSKHLILVTSAWQALKETEIANPRCIIVIYDTLHDSVYDRSVLMVETLYIILMYFSAAILT